MIRPLAYIVVNAIRFFRLVEFYQPTCNPKGYKLLGQDNPKRLSEDRLQQILGAIDLSSVHSYLDIGSQLGFYVFRFSEVRPELKAHGMEKDTVAHTYAQALKSLNRAANVFFVNRKITIASARSLPSYDLITFMNVFHHIVHFDGFEAADGIMRELYMKCNKCFVFETGQFDEKGYYWSDNLSFMGDHPIGWIQDYLLKIGYDTVALIGFNGTHLSDQKRGLFLCTKRQTV